MALMLSFSSQSVSQTSDIYLKEQAIMVSKSATEYALLAISGKDRSAGACINTIDGTFGSGFDVHITIKYFGLGALADCASIPLGGTLWTPESNGTVMIDVYVSQEGASYLHPGIAYHRRTLQKP